MADQLPRRIDYPTTSMCTGVLLQYLTRLATAVNQIPTFSYTSYSGGPNSNLTGAPGDTVINIVASAQTARLYTKIIGSGNTGWFSYATVA